MKKTFYKNLFRDIRKTFSRFLSIVIIIALGVAFYAGVRATSPDMKKSADLYFSETEFMDFKLISTLGLTEEDVLEVQKLKGVKSAKGAFSLDAVIEKDKRALVVNVNSIPSVEGINNIKILTGRVAKNNNEAVVETGFLKENKFKIGDEIEFKSGSDTKIGDDLKNSTFKIVGTALSPLYLSAQRQLSSVGNGSVKGFIYILPDVFKSDVFTEIYVKSNSEHSKDSLLFNEDYKKTSKTIEQNLKELGVIRSEIRYSKVLGDANSKINTAEEKLNASKKEAADKFSEGYKQINDAKDKIKQGKIELAKNQRIFNEKKAQGETQIAQGKKKLIKSQAELDLGKEQAASKISASIALKVSEAKKQLESDPSNEIYKAQYNGINEIYVKNIVGKDFDNMYNSLKTNSVLEQIKPFFDIELLKNNFDSSQSQIDIGWDELYKQEKLLKEGKLDLAAGSKKLRDGEKKIDENLLKLKSEEDKANIKIKEGEAEIKKNK
ncbi:MAG: ABC transporter permease, partial [Clostridiaceae bacterium]|nr:ABC transporter permease [Clostridiaceae bacterium]